METLELVILVRSVWLTFLPELRDCLPPIEETLQSDCDDFSGALKLCAQSAAFGRSLRKGLGGRFTIVSTHQKWMLSSRPRVATCVGTKKWTCWRSHIVKSRVKEKEHAIRDQPLNAHARWRDGVWSPTSRAVLWLLTGILVGLIGGESSVFRILALVLICVAFMADLVIIVRRLRKTRH